MEVRNMQCPYCNNEMDKGIISGDGRRKVCWYKDGEKIGMLDRMAGKGMIDAKYTLSRFKIEGSYCSSCYKMIFDTRVSLQGQGDGAFVPGDVYVYEKQGWIWRLPHVQSILQGS
jgi:hypothetical protein